MNLHELLLICHAVLSIDVFDIIIFLIQLLFIAFPIFIIYIIFFHKSREIKVYKKLKKKNSDFLKDRTYAIEKTGLPYLGYFMIMPHPFSFDRYDYLFVEIFEAIKKGYAEITSDSFWFYTDIMNGPGNESDKLYMQFLDKIVSRFMSRSADGYYEIKFKDLSDRISNTADVTLKENLRLWVMDYKNEFMNSEKYSVLESQGDVKNIKETLTMWQKYIILEMNKSNLYDCFKNIKNGKPIDLYMVIKYVCSLHFDPKEYVDMQTDMDLYKLAQTVEETFNNN